MTLAPLNAVQRQEALKLVAKYRAQQEEQRADYERDAAEDRANGYRPHYCIHGVNMWVDYDCACWQCEDRGNTLDPLDPYRTAMAVVRHRTNMRGKILDAIMLLNEEAALTGDELKDLWTRATSKYYPED